MKGLSRRPAGLVVVLLVVLVSAVLLAFQRWTGVTAGALGLVTGHVLAPLAQIPGLFGESESQDAKVAELEKELTRLRYLEQENARLESLLELRRRSHPRALAARLVGRDPNAWYHQVVADRGSQDGVSTATVAVGPRGLLGRVSEVARDSCRVRLLLDAESVVPVRLEGSGATGILYGQGGYTCVVRFVNHGVEVEKGEEVVTSGLGAVYPGGIPVGRVVRNYGREEALAQTIEVEPVADFSRLGEMLLVTGPK